MKIETLKEFLIKLAMENPAWKPLNNANLDSYFEVLGEIPEEIFIKEAEILRRSKLYGWPGAGEIYERCMGKNSAASGPMTDGERIWYKTLRAIDANKPHDEWAVADVAISHTCGSIFDIKTADEQKLKFMKRDFIKLVDSGLIQKGEVK